MDNPILNTLNDIERDWLTSPQSLTKRLREFTHNKITHHLLYDDWGIASDLALAALGITHTTRTWIRRMEWRCENKTWVPCTVIIPETSITKDTEELKNIKEKSIGDILFQDITLTRSNFTFYKNADGHLARHSVFYFKRQPLLIVENFLPAFFEGLCL
ncbi:MAG: chorismate lyase [Gammaproteobacteria bacterium]|nr:chorismate lyase [Gammaproteobacteria bacterium]